MLWLRSDDHRLCIPTIHISKVTLGTVGDAGDAMMLIIIPVIAAGDAKDTW